MCYFVDIDGVEPEDESSNKRLQIYVSREESSSSIGERAKEKGVHSGEGQKSLLKILMESMIDMEVMEKIPRYFFFFKNQLGITEVKLPNQPVRLFYFEKPFCCNFLSPFIKKHLVAHACTQDIH